MVGELPSPRLMADIDVKFDGSSDSEVDIRFKMDPFDL